MMDRGRISGVCAGVTLLLGAADLAWSQNPPTTTASPGGAIEKVTERGPVSAKVRLHPASVRIGDTVTFSIEVQSEAEVELLMPTFGSALGRFAIAEFVPRQSVDAQGRGTASQHYTLYPGHSGEHRIPPVTIEFVDRRPGQKPAPEGEDAYELLTESLIFTVESVVPADAGSALKPVMDKLPTLGETSADDSPAFIAAAGVMLLGLVIGLFAWWRRLRRPAASPFEMAMARLDSLDHRVRPDDREAMDAFFVELTDIVRRYLEQRFDLHAPELTTEEFLDIAADSADLTREHRGFLQTFLRNADQVKFAGYVPGRSDVDNMVLAVREFLKQTGLAAKSDPISHRAVPEHG